MIENIHKLEEAAVLMLNQFDGWDLKWTGKGFQKWDAEGKTPKGQDCVIEMKFRNKYYPEKMIEKDKYDSLIATGKVAIYFVSDPNGTYLYWLNNLKLPPLKEMYCPDTTMWTKKKIKKPVYLLNESLVSLKIIRDET